MTEVDYLMDLTLFDRRQRIVGEHQLPWEMLTEYPILRYSLLAVSFLYKILLCFASITNNHFRMIFLNQATGHGII